MGEEGSSPGNQVAGCLLTEGLFSLPAPFMSEHSVTKFLGNGGQACCHVPEPECGRGLPPGLRPGAQAKAAQSLRHRLAVRTLSGCKTRTSPSQGLAAPRRGLRAVQTGPATQQALRSKREWPEGYTGLFGWTRWLYPGSFGWMRGLYPCSGSLSVTRIWYRLLLYPPWGTSAP